MLLLPNSEELQSVADKLHKNRDIQVRQTNHTQPIRGNVLFPRLSASKKSSVS